MQDLQEKFSSRKPSTTVLTNLREMVSSAKGFSVLPKISSVTAESTRGYVTVVLPATVAALKLQRKRCAGSVWDTSNLQFRWLIWYFRSTPNKIGYLLGIPSKKLESILYYERYVVINAGAAESAFGYKECDLITEEEYFQVLDQLPKENQQLSDDDPDKFLAGMGAEAVYELLRRIDLDAVSFDLRNKAETEGHNSVKQRL